MLEKQGALEKLEKMKEKKKRYSQSLNPRVSLIDRQKKKVVPVDVEDAGKENCEVNIIKDSH